MATVASRCWSCWYADRQGFAEGCHSLFSPGRSFSGAPSSWCGDHARSVEMINALSRNPGYRLPEAVVGLHTFAESPFIGHGIGQATRKVYLPTFEVADVGPLYHSFWVTIMANLGIVGLACVLWPIFVALRVGTRVREGAPLGFSALMVGWIAGAMFAGPTDGHWELGLLPALTILAYQNLPSTTAEDPENRSVDTP